MKTLNAALDNKKRVAALVEKPFLYDKLKGIVGSENVTDKEIVMEAYTASALRRQRAGIQYIENVYIFCEFYKSLI